MFEFEDGFEQANKMCHQVETEWHYRMMTRSGFMPITKTAVGFVRSYHYENAAGHQIIVTHGVHADYWEDKTVKGCGLWGELEPHLKKLTG